MLNVKISEFKFKILKNVINNDLILQLIFKINQVIIFLIVLVQITQFNKFQIKIFDYFQNVVQNEIKNVLYKMIKNFDIKYEIKNQLI